MTSTGLHGLPAEFNLIIEFLACLSIIGLKLMRVFSSFIFVILLESHLFSQFLLCRPITLILHTTTFLSLSARSKMGILEFGHLHLYPLCRYPSKPGGPHLQGQVCQSGPVDAGTGPGQRSLHRAKHQDGSICCVLMCVIQRMFLTKYLQYAMTGFTYNRSGVNGENL